MTYLRQSTASQEIILGHFVDSTDGVTAETALTIANTDIKIWVTGATTLANKNSGGATHISGGIYYAVLDATDTATIGPMIIFVAVSGALAVRLECCVLDETVYDVLFGTTAISTYAGADTSGTTTLLSRIGGAITITSGRVNADVTHIATAAVSTSTAQLGVNVVNFGGSAGTFASGRPEVNTTHAAGTAWGSGAITAASIATGALTAAKFAAGAIDAAAIAADAGTEIATAVWASGTRTLTSLSGLTVDTVTTLTNLPAITANWLTAAGTAADFGTEIATAVTTAIGTGSALTSLATQASVNTIDDFLDTEVAAIISTLSGIVPVSGTIGATGNDTTHLHLSGLAYADDGINSLLITIKDVSTGLFYSRWIEDFANTGDLATVATLPFTPEASVDQYWITPVRSDVTGGSGLDAAGVRAAVGLASANLDTQLGDIDDMGNNIFSEAQSANAIVGNVSVAIGTPSNLGSGATVAANLADIESQTDDIGAAGAGLTALASAANLSTLTGYVDTEVAAIKAKTDQLTFTVANRVDSTTQSGVSTLDAAGIRTAVGLASANLDTQLTAIDDYLDTEVAALTTELAKVPKSDGTSTWNATALASLQSEATDALNAYDPPTRAELTTDINSVLAQLPAAPVKNSAFTYVVKMVDATDGMTPETGLTITVTRSIDGAAFASATGVVTEISTGHYKFVASAADMNGDFVVHKFAASGAQDLTMGFLTVS